MNKAIFQLSGHKGSITQVEKNRDDTELYSLCVDKSVKVWDLRVNRCRQTLDLRR